MIGVLLAGGSGQRLWPRCRQRTPKQFHDLLEQGETLLQSTYRHATSLVAPQDIWVITGSEWADLVKTQLPQVAPDQILTEPAGRNTGPAIAYFLSRHPKKEDGRTVAILPSDHWVADSQVLSRTLSGAAQLAQKDQLVLLGVTPDRPNTGYGYIRKGPAIDFDGAAPAFKIHHFREKPDLETAREMVASGGYLWNCGMFVARIGYLRQAFEDLAPEMLEAAADTDPTHEAWMKLEKTSIDYAIVEKLADLAVLTLQTAWTDLGTWDSLGRVLEKDTSANAVIGDHVISVNSEKNMVCANGRLIAMVGVKNLVIVDTPDALLVGHVNHMQYVKDVITELKSTGHSGVT